MLFQPSAKKKRLLKSVLGQGKKLKEETTIIDIIKTIIAGTIVLMVVWGIGQFEELKTITRFSFFFLFWLVSVCSIIFYKSDWKNFSFKYDWLELVIKVIGVIVWTIIFYLAAFHGIGLEEGPWENI
jgi:Mn2+/Fe2+ NRAMP family transporter